MGDRGNIKMLYEIYKLDGTMKKPRPAIYLYTHWGGSELAATLHSALSKKWRWDDPHYLSRIILDTMTDGSCRETGFGISPFLCDNEKPIIQVDCLNQIITLCDDPARHWIKNYTNIGQYRTFREFINMTPGAACDWHLAYKEGSNMLGSTYATDSFRYMLTGRPWMFTGFWADCKVLILKHKRHPVRAMLELLFTMAHQLRLIHPDWPRRGRRDLARLKALKAVRASIEAVRMNMDPFWNDLWEAAEDWTKRNPRQKPPKTQFKYTPVTSGEWRVELWRPDKPSWTAHKIVHVPSNINCGGFLYRKDCLQIMKRLAHLAPGKLDPQALLDVITKTWPTYVADIKRLADNFSNKKGPTKW